MHGNVKAIIVLHVLQLLTQVNISVKYRPISSRFFIETALMLNEEKFRLELVETVLSSVFLIAP